MVTHNRNDQNIKDKSTQLFIVSNKNDSKIFILNTVYVHVRFVCVPIEQKVRKQGITEIMQL